MTPKKLKPYAHDVISKKGQWKVAHLPILRAARSDSYAVHLVGYVLSAKAYVLILVVCTFLYVFVCI